MGAVSRMYLPQAWPRPPLPCGPYWALSLLHACSCGHIASTCTLPVRSAAKAFSLPLLPCSGPAARVVLQEAGHFTFLDSTTTLQQSVCSLGRADGAAVREASARMVLAWARACSAFANGSEGGKDGLEGEEVRFGRDMQEDLAGICVALGLECTVKVKLRDV